MNMKTSMLTTILFVCILLIPGYSDASITFTNGKWETTFAQATCPQQTLPSFKCDQMDNYLDNTAADGSHTLVTSAANNPNGGGGNGLSQVDGAGNQGQGNGVNDSSESVAVWMPSLQKELWMRMYIKYPSNWRSTSFSWDKIFYLYAAGQNPMIEPNETGFRLLCQGVNTQGCIGTQTTYKMSDMMGGTVGDNLWHAIEFHIKMDTTGTGVSSTTANGLGDLWIDGVNVIHATNINWSQGVAAAKNGIEYIAFSINQAIIQSVDGSQPRVFIDDIAIYNITPPNTDAQGRPFIGLLGATQTPTPSAPPVAVTPTSGVCGSANGTTVSTTPTTNLCSVGAASSVSGSGPWTWTCAGTGGGSTATCSASLTATVPPPSGTALFTESFDDTNFTARGWYDGEIFPTTSTGCISGSCAQFSFASSATNPSSPYAGAVRKAFTATESLYMSFYIKFATGWRGSQQTYHPHIMHVLSDLDHAANIYSPLYRSYLGTYVEFLSDIGSPYAIRPQIELQDALRVNSSLGTPPNNLTAVTENRSVTHCNTPISGGGGATIVGACYNDGVWRTETNYQALSASLSTNTWHKVEVFFQMNTVSGGKGQSDGIMQEWVDGVKVIDRSNVIYRTNQDPTKKWAQFVIAPYIGDGSPIAQTMWIDSLEVYSSPQGSAAINAITAPKLLKLIDIIK